MDRAAHRLAAAALAAVVAVPAGALAAPRCPAPSGMPDEVSLAPVRVVQGARELRAELAAADPYGEIDGVELFAGHHGRYVSAIAHRCGAGRWCATIPSFELEGDGELGWFAAALGHRGGRLACAGREDRPLRLARAAPSGREEPAVPVAETTIEDGERGHEAPAAALAAVEAEPPALLESPWFWAGAAVLAVAGVAVAVPLSSESGVRAPRGSIGTLEAR